MFQVVPENFCFDGKDLRCMAEKYLGQLSRRHGIEASDVDGAMAIIAEGKDMVQREYEPFMAFCRQEIEKSLAPYLARL